MYAQLADGTLAELDGGAAGESAVWPLMHGKDIQAPTYPARFVAVQPQRQARPSLYVATFRWVLKYDWDGRKWTMEYASTRNSAVPTGLAVGDFRGDGQTRIYVSYGTEMAEYTKTPVGWHRQAIPTSAGMMFLLSSGRSSATNERVLVLTDPDKKTSIARWRPEASVAVTDFFPRGVPQTEAAAVSDLLRARIVNIGNCRSLERQRISEVMQEQSIQQTGTFDPRTAVKLGRLLKADKVIIGSIGVLDGRKFAETSIVSVKTGAAERTESLRWSDDAELQKGIELLAQTACPDTTVTQARSKAPARADAAQAPASPTTSPGWARFKIADVADGWLKIVRLNGRPAIVHVAPYSGGSKLDIIRRISGDWRRESVSLGANTPMRVDACDAHGDGVTRIYVSYGKDPRISELTPEAGSWKIVDFRPNQDGVSPHSMDGGAIACVVSKTDHRAHLFLERPARKAIFECRWSGDWRCESIASTDNPLSWTYLYANPPGWSADDVLIDPGGVYERGRAGWAKRGPVAAYGALLVSKSNPRTLFSYGATNTEAVYNPDLTLHESEPLFARSAPQHVAHGMEKTLGMPAGPPGANNFLATDPNIGQTVGRMPGSKGESIFGVGGDGLVYQYRRERGEWSRSLVSGFPGRPRWVVAGDARGDGIDRLYVVEVGSDYKGGLWELDYFGGSSPVLVPDPVSSVIPADGAKLLGDLYRAELGRHGDVSVVSREGQTAAREERSLTGGATSSSGSEFRLRSSIESRDGKYFMSERLERADGEAPVREFVSEGVPRDKLPEAAVALALRMAEEWPRGRDGSSATPKSPPATPVRIRQDASLEGSPETLRAIEWFHVSKERTP